MAEKPEELTGGGEAAMKELEELKAKLTDAEKRAEDAQRKFEQTKTERAEERDKRQKEAEANKQYEEAMKLKDEKLAEMQAELEKAKVALTDIDSLKPKAQAWEEYQDKRRSELLEALPEDKREKFKTAPLDLLEETVSLIGSPSGGTHKGAAKSHTGNGSTKWSELSDAQKAEKARDLPVAELTKLIAAG